MSRSNRYPPEDRERAIRLVRGAEQEHSSEWAAIQSIAAKIGCTDETLRRWVRQSERDSGERAGLTTDEKALLKQLQREKRELKQANPSWLPQRAKRDELLLPEFQRVYGENFRVYGARKVWLQLNRKNCDVARCTVEQLIARLGLSGAVRGGKKYRTTMPDASAAVPADQVNCQFQAKRPNQLRVADFTYVSTWAGVVFVAFVIFFIDFGTPIESKNPEFRSMPFRVSAAYNYSTTFETSAYSIEA